MCSFQNFSNKRSYKTPINKQKHAKAAFVLSENEAGQCYSRASREQGELLKCLSAIGCRLWYSHSTIRPCASMSLFKSRPNQGLTRKKKKEWWWTEWKKWNEGIKVKASERERATIKTRQESALFSLAIKVLIKNNEIKTILHKQFCVIRHVTQILNIS